MVCKVVAGGRGCNEKLVELGKGKVVLPPADCGWP